MGAAPGGGARDGDGGWWRMRLEVELGKGRRPVVEAVGGRAPNGGRRLEAGVGMGRRSVGVAEAGKVALGMGMVAGDGGSWRRGSAWSGGRQWMRLEAELGKGATISGGGGWRWGSTPFLFLSRAVRNADGSKRRGSG
uniref:DUF834 domain-containing protein n=1 Tax=Oryza glumipatula TaxID=40148 RepID=A0A0D9Y7H2_9ORYZ